MASQVRDSGALRRQPRAEPASQPMSEDEVEQDDSGDEGEGGDGNENETGSSGRPARGLKRKKGGRRNTQVRGKSMTVVRRPPLLLYVKAEQWRQ